MSNHSSPPQSLCHSPLQKHISNVFEGIRCKAYLMNSTSSCKHRIRLGCGYLFNDWFAAIILFFVIYLQYFVTPAVRSREGKSVADS